MKKPKQKLDSSAIKVSRSRESGKKKVDLFANFRRDHPLDDIFPEEAVNKESQVGSSDQLQTTLPDFSEHPIDTGYPTKIDGIPYKKGTPKTAVRPKVSGTPKISDFPVSPARDFTKTPNSITKYILAHGLFKGKSKQVYDYFWSQSRGNIKPLRTTQRTNKQIKDGTGLGSKNTVADAIKHLEEIGLIIKTTTAGESGGNTYEVFTPEEVGYPNLLGIPSQIGILGEDGMTTQKSGYPGIPEIGIPSNNQIVVKSTTYDTSKTSLKTNTNDDEERLAFSSMIDTFAVASRNLIGKGISSRDREKWRELAELLVDELNQAAQKTDSISNVPAFLTEHLRRKFAQSSSLKTSRRSTPIFKASVKAPGAVAIEPYEAEPLSSEGRQNALAALRTMRDTGEPIEIHKESYSDTDWQYLITELEK